LGPWWLLREMIDRGPGNYMLVAPTFKLLDKTAVPALKYAWRTLLGLGDVIGGASGAFHVSEEGHRKLWPHLPYTPTRVVFGYAENPDSLESLTAKAAWLDECGQKQFKKESHEAIQARLAVNEGRIIYTSTPYVHHWLKTEVHDRAVRYRKANKAGLVGDPVDADYDSVSFESRQNPAFPAKEWDRQQRVLPPWRFAMRYKGEFTRPAGAVYDCFDRDYHVVPAFEIPADWPRASGLDFGAPNYAGVFVGEEAVDEPRPGGRVVRRKTGKFVVYAEYRPAEAKTTAAHVAAMRALVPGVPGVIVGGSKSEVQWRVDHRAAGWPVREPDQPDVEVGIERVYALIREGRLFVSDACPLLIEDLLSYSRPVDEDGNVLEGIEDKETHHLCDALRYVGSYLNRKGGGVRVATVGG
jgi:hypothetical protein